MMERPGGIFDLIELSREKEEEGDKWQQGQ